MEPDSFVEEFIKQYVDSVIDLTKRLEDMSFCIGGFFSKLLGARVMLVENPDDPYYSWHCEHCAYKNICGNLPNDILLSDGCTCSLTGWDAGWDDKQVFNIVEQVYSVEELHKILFEINNSYIENAQEKLELMELLINVEYLTNNNISGETRGI